ncbi:MAG: hypothetical protein NT166_06055 [Candidatus Aminicenantes bacterium]|nr:hypothetical protein [Candidatus Aminicenantes bacterium]
MTPPTLTEAWSIGYIQALITLLIFVFGLPIFVLQNTSENIRYIINKYMKKVIWAFLGTVILIVLFVLCFVWFLHPCSSPFFPYKDIGASFLVTIALMSAPLIWMGIQMRTLREKVATFLGKKIQKQFEKDGSLLVDETIDMITMGERSEAGYEKEVVLDALDSLVGKIQKSDKYSCANLDQILKHFNKIVTGKDKPGNERDFNLAVDILEKIIRELHAVNFSIYGDEILVYQSLTEIGKKAAELRFSKVTLRIVQIFSSNPRALFEIGLSAFKVGDYFAATTALNTLKTLALETPSDEGHCANYFLGLLAHFWRENRGSKRKAETFLEDIKDKFSPLTKYLDNAIKSHYASIHYDTADKLMEMRDEIMKIRGQEKGRAEKDRSEEEKRRRREEKIGKSGREDRMMNDE